MLTFHYLAFFVFKPLLKVHESLRLETLSLRLSRMQNPPFQQITALIYHPVVCYHQRWYLAYSSPLVASTVTRVSRCPASCEFGYALIALAQLWDALPLLAIMLQHCGASHETVYAVSQLL